MRGQRWMALVWGCFLVRLLFYCSVLPLWEGYDEWAHFAVIERMAARGEVLVARDAPVGSDVEASLSLAPVPWELRSLNPPALTQDGYWQLDPADRARRESQLRRLPVEWGTGKLTAYEALQPPLYYWLMAPVLWTVRWLGAGLLTQVLALRIVSSLIASLAIPLVFLTARRAGLGDGVALGCAAIVTLMPGLALDIARAGNDCLAVVLFTAVTLLAVDAVEKGPSLWLGVALGLGLLTKAYFLTAIPVVGGILLLDRRRDGRWTRVAGIAAAPLLLAGWWYARNWWTTGTLSGLSESVMLRGSGVGGMMRQAAAIHWLKAVDSILLSHLYFGGWSSLTVRSWMYHVFYVAAAIGAVGVARLWRNPAIATLAAVYACFWAGQTYNVILLYMSKGLGGSMGWYMYAVVAAEVVLSVAGCRRMAPARVAVWAPAGGAVLFALLDLYTMHAVAIPYYTGMIRHRANGSLAALHGDGFTSVGIAGAVERLGHFVPGAVVVGLWLLYLAATVAAVACACARIEASLSD